MKKFSFILLLLLLLVVGCGYKHTQTKLKKPVKVYVKYVKNNTDEPRLEDYFTEALKNQFIKRKDTLLVSDLGKADLLIKGQIKNFKYAGISFLSSDRSLEYRVSMIVEISLIDKNGVLLKTKDFYEYKEFKTGISEGKNINIDVGIIENLRPIIYKKLSSIIAEDVFDWMFAGF